MYVAISIALDKFATTFSILQLINMPQICQFQFILQYMKCYKLFVPISFTLIIIIHTPNHKTPEKERKPGGNDGDQ